MDTDLRKERKRQDFLWLVAMIMQRNEGKIKGWPGIAGDAVAASYRIPDDYTAREAAFGFCKSAIPEFNGNELAEVPGWMIGMVDR